MEFSWDHLVKRLENVTLMMIESSDWAMFVSELGDVSEDMVFFQEMSDVTENVEFEHSNESSDSSNDGNDVSM